MAITAIILATRIEGQELPTRKVAGKERTEGQRESTGGKCQLSATQLGPERNYYDIEGGVGGGHKDKAQSTEGVCSQRAGPDGG